MVLLFLSRSFLNAFTSAGKVLENQAMKNVGTNADVAGLKACSTKSRLPWQRRSGGRQLAAVGSLLVGVAELEQRSFRERSSQKLQTHR